jgi:hypothetical protein
MNSLLKLQHLIQSNHKKKKICNFTRFVYKTAKKNNRIKWILKTKIKRQGINSKNNREEKVFISLTSYPQRFDTIIPCLKSLLLQTVKPDKIQVWLDCAPELVTNNMLALEKYGVEYHFITINLKPHNKYFFAMQQYPDALIITVDDDIIYPKDLVKKLISCHKKYPTSVCANRVHKMTFTQGKTLKRYNDWEQDYVGLKTPSHILLATGVGGVLYPPHCLDERVFSIGLIKKYCLTADDIWLKAMEVLNNTKVVWTGLKGIINTRIEEAQKTGLLNENVTKNKNDIFIQNIITLYKNELQTHFSL